MQDNIVCKLQTVLLEHEQDADSHANATSIQQLLSRAVGPRRCVLHAQNQIVVAKAIQLLDGLICIVPAAPTSYIQDAKRCDMTSET